MQESIRLAFSHPLERSRADFTPPHLDRIALRDYLVAAEIGAFQGERGTMQRLRFNVAVEVTREPMTLAGTCPGVDGDDIDRVLSYDRVTEAINMELAAQRVDLLETLAERIAARILARPQAVRCFIRVEKLDRSSGALGIEIVRTAADLRLDVSQTTSDGEIYPHIVLLGNEAIASANLGAWLDTEETQHKPLILCADKPSVQSPSSSAVQSRLRIDLLAIEQNAWVLAGRDPRCIVVSTRTEMEWRMRNGLTSVWAPSKLVLDSGFEIASDTGTKGIELARWLAARLGARQLREFNSKLPLLGGQALPA